MSTIVNPIEFPMKINLLKSLSHSEYSLNINKNVCCGKHVKKKNLLAIGSYLFLKEV